MSLQIQEFDYNVDILAALLWQDNNASNITGLLTYKQDWYDVNQEQFWEDWYTNVFNLQTANDFGLAVWSIILDLPLFYQLDNGSPPIFGFSGSTSGRYNFNNGVLASPRQGYSLTTAQKRIALQLRYFDLVNNMAIPEINKFMNFVFQDLGLFYCINNYYETMTYVYMFQIDATLLEVLIQYDLLPRPATVNLKIYDGLKPVFGFNGSTSGRYNFNNGVLR